ncbi:MAG TPA: apolipoprotein N-acyltransferase [Acidimicrobiia bacterium]|nr:apolipoprotein N-acyltransferase [Acidimicrobiia bacterium]
MTDLFVEPAWVEVAARTDLAAAPEAGVPRRWAVVATGLLLALAFPPFDLGPLALVAPLPLVMRWMHAPGGARRAAVDGFIAGAVFFAVLLAWSWYFGVVAYFPFVIVLALYWAAAGGLVGALASRGVRGPWVVAAAWVVFEALRGRWPLGGFSWGEVGYAYHDVPAMRSVAAWGGVLAVSFVSVLVTACLAEAIVRWRGGGRSAARRPLSVALAAVAVVGLAHVGVPETRDAGTLRVAIVQGNDRNRQLSAGEIRERFLPESHFELAGGLERPLDLVVLPESSLDEDPRVDPSLDRRLGALARRLDASVLSNAAVEIENGERLHNTTFWHDPSGELSGTYIKRHLVPFGEYVPGRQFLGFVDELDQIPRDHAPGSEPAIFTVRGAGGEEIDVGNLICFESAFTELARDYAADGAEVLVVSTNNRSFRRSANSSQHIAIGQLRAAETGRSVVHAAVSGRSALIDPDGDVTATTGLFERATLDGMVSARTGRTPYVVAGDWVVLLAGAILVGAAWAARKGSGSTPKRFARFRPRS